MRRGALAEARSHAVDVDRSCRVARMRQRLRVHLNGYKPELAAHVLSLAAPRCPLYRAVEDAVAEANARGAADSALAIQTGNDGEAH